MLYHRTSFSISSNRPKGDEQKDYKNAYLDSEYFLEATPINTKAKKLLDVLALSLNVIIVCFISR